MTIKEIVLMTVLGLTSPACTYKDSTQHNNTQGSVPGVIQTTTESKPSSEHRQSLESRTQQVPKTESINASEDPKIKRKSKTKNICDPNLSLDFRNFRLEKDIQIYTTETRYKTIKSEIAGIKDIRKFIYAESTEGVWYFTPKDNTWYWANICVHTKTKAQSDSKLFKELVRNYDKIIVYHNHSIQDIYLPPTLSESLQKNIKMITRTDWSMISNRDANLMLTFTILKDVVNKKCKVNFKTATPDGIIEYSLTDRWKRHVDRRINITEANMPVTEKNIDSIVMFENKKLPNLVYLELAMLKDEANMELAASLDGRDVTIKDVWTVLRKIYNRDRNPFVKTTFTPYHKLKK